ncbi:hypothetical protein J23TS9_31960 [Paenibacillus sp. J23TS9]|nr:hypothetical protein J23TS9_31960 [Paenibacillus sp. J23TS9]
MMNVPQMMPFHHAYPRPQVTAVQKKDNSIDKPLTFKEVLTEKLNQKR